MHNPDEIFSCSCCAHLVRWRDLRWVGTQEVPADGALPGYFLEYRNHETPDCGTTITRERPLDDAEARRDAERYAEIRREQARARAVPRWTRFTETVDREIDLANIAARGLARVVGGAA